MPHWIWRWHAEIEKFPSAVLAARHPQSINLGDVNAEDFVARAEKAGRPDVIVFGSPCQDFSVAGQRVGLDGDRGNLALVALRVIAKLRPRWVVFENVPGLLSSYSGSAEAERSLRDRGLRGDAGVGDHTGAEEDSDFAAFLSLVQQCGYFGCYRIVDAQFAGVPQRRRRIFAVFHLGDWRPAAAVLLEPESLRGDSPPSREAGERVAPTIEARANAGGAGWETDFMSGGELAAVGEGLPMSGMRGGERYSDVRVVRGGAAFGGNNTAGPIEQATAVRAKGGTGHGDFESETFVVETPIAFTCKDWGGDAAPDQSPTLRSMEFDGSHANGGGQVAVAIPIQNAIRGKAQNGLGVADAGAPMFTLDQGSQHAVAFQTRVARNGRGSESELVPALNGADAGATSDMRPCVAVFKPSHYTRGKDGQPSGVSPPLGAEPDKGDQDPVLLAGTQVRRLTPIECERLQAYEDNYTLIKFRGKPAADGPRYKALGNSMCVNDVRWVLERIERFEKEVRA